MKWERSEEIITSYGRFVPSNDIVIPTLKSKSKPRSDEWRKSLFS
jgi:hypothetical protein